MSDVSPYRCEHIPELQETYPGTIPLLSIQESAASGCLLCPVLLAAIDPLLADQNPSLATLQILGSLASGLSLKIVSAGKETQQESGTIELFCSEDIGRSLIPKSQPICADTSDGLAFQRIVNWAMSCIKTHTLLCNVMSDNNGLLPHRILDLGVDETSPIVLKETVEGEREQYACLSHSWGGHQPLQTTTATLEERKKGIQWKDLPRTFQDAVSFTRRLNLRYIWIDSLCIIQDDGDDWAAESALMADIYRNATITVSAAASKGPHDGLFVSTQPQHQGTKLTPVFVEPPNPLPSFYTRHPISHDRKDQPLLDRGWVLQERLLSPRVIHFGTYELVWECMQASNCECDRVPSRLTWFTEKQNFHPAALSNLPLPFTANAWRKVVQDFCGLTLTYAKDAFPAVSGSAKIVKQSLEERGVEAKYIAGMWDCWFVEDCLWSVTAPAVRPDEWRAPTFSWASVLISKPARLMYRSTSLFESGWRKAKPEIDAVVMTLHATLKSHERKLEGCDETGRVLSASVILKGPLVQAKYSGGSLIIPGQQMGGEPDFNPDFDFSIPGQNRVEDDATLWCLQFASLRIPLDDPRHEYLWLVVLRQVDIERDGQVVYERVGLLRYRESFDIKRPVEKWFYEESIIQSAIVKIV